MRSPVSKTSLTGSGSEEQFQMRWLCRSQADTAKANAQRRRQGIRQKDWSPAAL